MDCIKTVRACFSEYEKMNHRLKEAFCLQNACLTTDLFSEYMKNYHNLIKEQHVFKDESKILNRLIKCDK